LVAVYRAVAQMSVYCAYLIGRDGHIQHRIDLIAADDDAAKERANVLVDRCDSDIELWQFDRRDIRAQTIRPPQFAAD
jgi:hypothetical protein